MNHDPDRLAGEHDYPRPALIAWRDSQLTAPNDSQRLVCWVIGETPQTLRVVSSLPDVERPLAHDLGTGVREIPLHAIESITDLVDPS